MKNKIIYISIVISLCLLACATIGIPNTYGLFYQPLSDILNTGKANATLHVSIAGLATGFSSPLIVKALKKISYRTVMISGILMLGISGIIIGNSQSLLLVNCMGIIRGIGLACTSNVIITMLTGKWFMARRGTISGLIMSFSGIMGSLFSPVVSKMLVNYGFRNAYLICILLMIVLALPSIFIPLKPEDIRMKAYGYDQKDVVAKDSYEGYYDLSFASKAFLLLITTSFLIICVTTLTSYLPSYVESLKQSAGNGAALLSASMVGNVLFKFLIGISIDRKGVFFSFVTFMSISFIGLLLIVTLPHNYPVLLIAGVLYGACYAVNKVAIPLTVRIFFGDEKYGEAYSVLSLCENISRSFIITSIGFIFDHSGSYLICFFIALAASIASSAMILYQKNRIEKEN
ncbi:MAG: MFS transporter [Erysipelotrichaceae bacterium]|nr:MFS transporter [Erysipelotrichaceae bacterium]